MSFLPRSRTQEYKNNDDGTQTLRCYSHSNPHYYKDSDGNYHDIDLSHTSSLSNSNIGNFTLKDKNVQYIKSQCRLRENLTGDIIADKGICQISSCIWK